MEKLRHIDESALSIRRKRYGRGFQYFGANGRKITDKRKLRRFRKLAIPPMWDDVLVCKLENGHIQAIGRDRKGRRQYIYHPEWERRRQQEKFARMAQFGRRLPGLRKRCRATLRASGWSRDKVLALMLMVLDDTGIRAGNKSYTRENQTHGLSTLRRKHLELRGKTLLLRFKGKGGKERGVEIGDPALARMVRHAASQPGYELFRYKDEGGQWQTVDSEDLNDAIHDLLGDGFSCKDFRTWVATRLAVEWYPEAAERKKESPRRKLENILLRKVADELGNTPAVCREHYVHPAILQAVREGTMPAPGSAKDDRAAHGYSAAEKLALRLLPGS